MLFESGTRQLRILDSGGDDTPWAINLQDRPYTSSSLAMGLIEELVRLELCTCEVTDVMVAVRVKPGKDQNFGRIFIGSLVQRTGFGSLTAALDGIERSKQRAT